MRIKFDVSAGEVVVAGLADDCYSATLLPERGRITETGDTGIIAVKALRNQLATLVRELDARIRVAESGLLELRGKFGG